MSLQILPVELERGWVEFACAEHGVVAVTAPCAVVRCRCGRRARPSLNGTPLRARDIARLRKQVQKSLQIAGSTQRKATSERARGRIRPKPFGAAS
jgi:hypothetical protein